MYTKSSINLVLFFLIVFLSSSCSNKYSKNIYPVMQGLTSKNYTSFNIITDKDSDIKFKIYQGPKLIPSEFISENTISNEHLGEKVIKKVILDLREYEIEINREKILNLKIKNSDYQEIRSFYLKENTSQKKIAIASCMNDHFKNEQKQIWKNLSNLKPDMIFLIGDNVYVDHGLNLEQGSSPELLWTRYLETRDNLKLFKLKQLIPVAMIWDDHDYGFNDGGRDYIHKDEAKKVFKAFSMNENPELSSSGPGAAWTFKNDKNKFIFMDNRSFRESNEDIKGAHFGEEQINWLKNELNSSPESIYIISGDQFQGFYHPFESFQGNHKKKYHEFLRILKSIKQSETNKKLTLISGDRHISEIQAIPELPGSYEVSSSPIHSYLPPKKTLKDYPNPNRIWALAGEHNFCILNTQKRSIYFYTEKSATEAVHVFNLN